VQRKVNNFQCAKDLSKKGKIKKKIIKKQKPVKQSEKTSHSAADKSTNGKDRNAATAAV